MSNYAMYFSPTGGTKKVLDIVEENIPCDSEIDLTNITTDYSKFIFQEEDVVLVAVPSYGGRVPAIAVERIGQTQGNGAKAVLIVVFGNRAIDDTLLELRNLMQKANFKCAAAVQAVAEHSIMRQFATSRPDQTDKDELSRFSEKILEIIKKDVDDNLNVPGNYPYKEYGGVPLKPKANSRCTKCSKCADRCPVEAISKSNPMKTEENKCISCMRCISECPRDARQLNSVMVKVAAMGMKKVCSERKENILYI